MATIPPAGRSPHSLPAERLTTSSPPGCVVRLRAYFGPNFTGDTAQYVAAFNAAVRTALLRTHTISGVLHGGARVLHNKGALHALEIALQSTQPLCSLLEDSATLSPDVCNGRWLLPATSLCSSTISAAVFYGSNNQPAYHEAVLNPFPVNVSPADFLAAFKDCAFPGGQLISCAAEESPAGPCADAIRVVVKGTAGCSSAPSALLLPGYPQITVGLRMPRLPVLHAKTSPTTPAQPSAEESAPLHATAAPSTPQQPHASPFSTASAASQPPSYKAVALHGGIHHTHVGPPMHKHARLLHTLPLLVSQPMQPMQPAEPQPPAKLLPCNGYADGDCPMQDTAALPIKRSAENAKPQPPPLPLPGNGCADSDCPMQDAAALPAKRSAADALSDTSSASSQSDERPSALPHVEDDTFESACAKLDALWNTLRTTHNLYYTTNDKSVYCRLRELKRQYGALAAALSNKLGRRFPSFSFHYKPPNRERTTKALVDPVV